MTSTGRIASTGGSSAASVIARGTLLALALLILSPNQSDAQPPPMKSSPAAVRQFNVAVGFHNKKLYDLATDEWKAFIEKFPDDELAPQARFFLGYCHQMNKSYDDAIATFKELIQKSPKFERLEDAQYRLADCYFAQGRAGKPDGFAAALAASDAFLKAYPQGKLVPEVLYLKGESLYAQDKKADAAGVYAALVKGHPQHELADDALYALGVAQQELNQPAEAAKSFDAFLAAHGKARFADEVRLRRGELYFAAGQYREAAPLFSAAANAGGFALADYAWLRFGSCQYALKDYAAAAKAYGELLAKFPQSTHKPQATLDLGRSQYALGQFAAVQKTLAPLLVAEQKLAADAAHWIVRSQLKEQQFPAALRSVDIALALPKIKDDPGYPQLLLDRADVLYEIPERRKEALAGYAKLSTEYASSPLAAEALYLASFTALDVGEPKEAIRYGKEFLQKFPGNAFEPDVLFVVAESQLVSADYAGAEASYRDLQKKHPQHPTVAKVPLRLGLALYLAKKYPDAIGVLQQAVQQKPPAETLAEAQHMIGRCYSETKKYPEAAKALEAALAAKADWKHADETLLVLGFARAETKDWKGATAAWQQLVTGFPQSNLRAEALYRSGDALLAGGDAAAAIASYEKVLKDYPQDKLIPAVQQALGLAYLNQGQRDKSIAVLGALISGSPQSDLVPKARFARGIALRQASKFQEAASDLEAFLATKPAQREASDARYELSLAYTGLNQPQKAAAVLQQILTEDRDYPGADKVYYELGWSWKAQQDAAKSYQAFQQLATAFPNSPLAADAFFHVGEHFYNAKDYDKAVAAYRTSVTKAGTKPIAETAQHKLGWSLYRQGEWAPAAEQFGQQATAFPQGKLASDAACMQGECLLKLSRYADALAAYKQAIAGYAAAAGEANPTFYQLALLHAAQCAGKLPQPNYAEALAYCETFLKTFQESAWLGDIQYEKAYALEQTGKLDEALKTYELVPDLTDTEVAARAYFMRGEILFGQKNHKEAIRNFFKAAYSYSYPQWAANSLFEAGRCFEVLGRREEAIKVYQEILDTYKDSDKAQLARDRMKALGS